MEYYLLIAYRSGHECPNPQQTKCYDCGEIGHIGRDCLKSSGYPQARACYGCGGTGHIRRDCPQAQGGQSYAGVVCRSCNQPGHIARDCQDVKCYICMCLFCSLSFSMFLDYLLNILLSQVKTSVTSPDTARRLRKALSVTGATSRATPRLTATLSQLRENLEMLRSNDLSVSSDSTSARIKQKTDFPTYFSSFPCGIAGLLFIFLSLAPVML